jgi:hypothetical protein
MRKRCVSQTRVKLNQLPSVKNHDLFIISVQAVLFVGWGRCGGQGPKKTITLQTEAANTIKNTTCMSYKTNYQNRTFCLRYK